METTGRTQLLQDTVKVIEQNGITCPRSTPWGRADSVKQIVPGIWYTSTPGHGGYYVAGELWHLMPTYMKETQFSRNGWFEEDCDWVLVDMVFWCLIEPTLQADDAVKQYNLARQIFANWHPQKWATWVAGGGQ